MSFDSEPDLDVLYLNLSDNVQYNYYYRGIFSASKQQVPCLAHVLNLAVQALLGKSGLRAAAPNDVQGLDAEMEDDSDGFIRDPIGQYDAENTVDDEQPEGDDGQELANDAPDNGNLDNSVCIKRALQKLRKGLVKIRYSTTVCI